MNAVRPLRSLRQKLVLSPLVGLLLCAFLLVACQRPSPAETKAGVRTTLLSDPAIQVLVSYEFGFFTIEEVLPPEFGPDDIMEPLEYDGLIPDDIALKDLRRAYFAGLEGKDLTHNDLMLAGTLGTEALLPRIARVFAGMEERADGLRIGTYGLCQSALEKITGRRFPDRDSWLGYLDALGVEIDP